jgi:hypothetical protein
MNGTYIEVLNTLCNNCELEEYRETLEIIVEDIFAMGCEISLVQKQESQFVSKEEMGDSALILLGYLHKKDKVDIIWALLKEFGNLANEPIDANKANIPSYKFSREQFAWGFARDQIVKYPLLNAKMASFATYRMDNRCI